jgi:hypothetical protein
VPSSGGDLNIDGLRGHLLSQCTSFHPRKEARKRSITRNAEVDEMEVENADEEVENAEMEELAVEAMVEESTRDATSQPLVMEEEEEVMDGEEVSMEEDPRYYFGQFSDDAAENNVISEVSAGEEEELYLDDGEQEIPEFNYSNIVDELLRDAEMRVRVEVYLYALCGKLTHEGYRQFRKLSIVDSRHLPKNFQDLTRSVRRLFRDTVKHDVVRIRLGDNKIVKIPYVSMTQVAGLLYGSPYHLEQVLQFNTKFIDPYIDCLDHRISELERQVNLDGLGELESVPGLLKLLKRTEQYWRRKVDACRREDIPVLWDLKLMFSDGFSWMGKAASKNQWSKLLCVQ